MPIEQQLRTVGKKTFVKCFAEAEEAQRHGDEIATERVAACDYPDSAAWGPNSLATKAATIRAIFRDGNQCQALKMCFTILGNPAVAAEAERLHSEFCSRKAKTGNEPARSPRDLALIWAASLEDSSTFILLFSQGADINAKDANGQTALHWAAMHGRVNIIGMLLLANADINARDNEGNTALHFAKVNRNAEAVRVLEDAGRGSTIRL